MSSSHKKTIFTKRLLVFVVAVCAFLAFVSTPPQYVRADTVCADGGVVSDAAAAIGGCGKGGVAAGGNAAAESPDGRGDAAAGCDPTAAGSKCSVDQYIIVFINVLSAAVGAVVVAMIVFGGIQYSTAGDDPAKIGAAKKRIINALFALVAFIFLFGFLQYLVPGGIF